MVFLIGFMLCLLSYGNVTMGGVKGAGKRLFLCASEAESLTSAQPTTLKSTN